MPDNNGASLGKQVDENLKVLFDKILKPEPSADPLMLGGQSVDNVAWVDFTDVRFAIDPIIPDDQTLPHTTFVAPVAKDLEYAADVEDEGGNGDIYLAFLRNMERCIEAALKKLFETRTAVYQLGYYVSGKIIYWDYRSDIAYNPDTGDFQVTFTADPYWWDTDPDLLPTYTYKLQLRNLAAWVVLAAKESKESDDLIADLMEVHDAVVASGNAEDAFWVKLSNLMTTERFDASTWVAHYVTLYFFFNQDTPPNYYTAKSSINFQNSSAEHWPTALAGLKTYFSAHILAATQAAEQYVPPPILMDHNFATFRPYFINCGLRLVYRQTWRHLGNQRGEVVRTIPLGPKQTEKVSTKILRRTKFAKTAENLKSTETTTETSDIAKDSSEIMSEAMSSKNFTMNVSTEASVNVGVFSGKTAVEASGGKQESEKTGEKQAHLTETMQKVASKVRQETKVVVSMESEESFEIATASEITNPNDEIAVTYVYSKLQRQFQILTQLAELQDVIMIAEPLPKPHEITAEWVKRYDWILSKALLDDSYRDALNSITQDAGVNVRSDIADKLSKVMDSTVSALGGLATAASSAVSKIDFVAESQKNYRETAEAKAEASNRNKALEAQRNRLFQHICDNVLYYCRAIYAQEDPQQRALRYKLQEVQVPLDWKFMALAINLPGRYPFRWVPVLSEAGGRWVDIADAINPAGPIGYFGNYSMYYIRPELRDIASAEPRPRDSKTLFELMDSYKTPYLTPAVDVDGNPIPDEYQEGTVMDPVLIDLLVNTWRQSQVTDEHLNDDTAREMKQVVPALRVMVAEQKPIFKDDLKKYYAEYQFYKKQQRLCVIDTNSLMIDLLPGEGSTLEAFKQAHRGMDVLKVREETRKIEHDNERRQELIKEHIYGDPDVEKVVEIRSDNTTVGAVIAEEASVEE